MMRSFVWSNLLSAQQFRNSKSPGLSFVHAIKDATIWQVIIRLHLRRAAILIWPPLLGTKSMLHQPECGPTVPLGQNQHPAPLWISALSSQYKLVFIGFGKRSKIQDVPSSSNTWLSHGSQFCEHVNSQMRLAFQMPANCRQQHNHLDISNASHCLYSAILDMFSQMSIAGCCSSNQFV